AFIMLVFDFGGLCKKLELESGSISSFSKSGTESYSSLFCLSDFTGGVTFMGGDEFSFGVVFGGDDFDCDGAVGFGIRWTSLHRAYASHVGCSLKELKEKNEEWDLEMFESDWYGKLVDEFIWFIKSRLGV
ncbi:MAG: hypothetical protein U9R37_02390, partial [Campylobacterota bacterium]|nr:hypothetical protein [Campylobacterota bacterium]